MTLILYFFFEHWNDDDALQMAAFTPADAKDRAAFEERVVGWGRGYATARDMASGTRRSPRSVRPCARIFCISVRWVSSVGRQSSRWDDRGRSSHVELKQHLVDLRAARVRVSPARADDALLERGSVLRVGGREGCHLQRVVVVPVLEEGVEIAVFDLPQDHHGPDDRS